jgi:hypothetical protein
VARWLFRLRGTPLTEDAVDMDHCGRCTPDAIHTYLTSIVDQLDIDDDGEERALGDGVLVLRWMTGFHDDALINGAVDEQHCLRCSATEIEDYLSTLD